MACFGPLTGYYSKVVNASGKRSLVFKVQDAFSAVPVVVPCSRCAGCRLEKARQWAMRCMHESRCWPHNSFVTLTYDTGHLPDHGFLSRRDIQLFMKRLRKRRASGSVRVYGCAEYGSLNKRPHYHLILFNTFFPDRKFYSRKADGTVLFTSAELRDVWPYGFNVIGDVTFASAGYVAGYVMDKVNGKMQDEHYAVYDADGVVHVRPPEFPIISRGRAIGADYYDKYGAEVYTHDTVIVNGKEVRPPRAYDVRYGLTDPENMVRIKRRRRRLALLGKADNSSRRRRVKELVLLSRLKRKQL